jgi:hypothetical protein
MIQIYSLPDGGIAGCYHTFYSLLVIGISLYPSTAKLVGTSSAVLNAVISLTDK